MSSRKSKPVALSAVAAPFEMGNINKIELIKKFQRLEGSLDCYASAYARGCNQFDCLWRDECLAAMRHGDSHEQGNQ